MSTSELGANLPSWWNDRTAAAWSRSRAAAISDWRHHGDQTQPVDDALEERALAFGHGARSVYSHVTTWDTVSPRLRAEWIHLGNVGAASWDRIAALVRHEWSRAAGPGGDAGPETA